MSELPKKVKYTVNYDAMGLCLGIGVKETTCSCEWRPASEWKKDGTMVFLTDGDSFWVGYYGDNGNQPTHFAVPVEIGNE